MQTAEWNCIFPKNGNSGSLVSYPQGCQQQKPTKLQIAHNHKSVLLRLPAREASLPIPAGYLHWMWFAKTQKANPPGLSDQGKGIPHLMALCGKRLISCNSNLQSQCVLGDLICHEECDHCYGYQTPWTTEG